MKRFAFLSFLISVSIISCESYKSSEEVFAAAKEKILSANRLSFNQLMVWEDPNLGEFDTIRYESIFQLNPNAELGYDFYGKREDVEFWFTENVQYQVDHSDSVMMVLEDFPGRIESNSFRSFSPVNLLAQKSWVFVQDTIINQKTLLDFVWIEMDTVVMDKKVLLENHLFINPANALPESLARRLYHDGKRNQLIEVFFSKYEFEEKLGSLQPIIPQGYISKVEGEKEIDEIPLLNTGDLAPDFELTDEKGNLVKLSQFRGKKVLLDFSMIHCGWCKIAIDQFNKPDYQFAENIVPLYINPVDSQEKMDKYLSKVTISFPVLTNALEVGKAYGVSGYPTFYLIDENGKVEDVVVGFSDEEILKWKK